MTGQQKERNANMKKLGVLLTILVMAVAFTACGEKKEEGIASQVKIHGTQLALGAEFTSSAEDALGEKVNEVQAPSCHYDGTDNIYYYDGFTVYTYMEGEKSIVYSIELESASLSTPEGAKTGMSLDDIKKIYGEDFEETVTGISYAITEGRKLNFRASDGAVTLIEYYAE